MTPSEHAKAATWDRCVGGPTWTLLGNAERAARNGVAHEAVVETVYRVGEYVDHIAIYTLSASIDRNTEARR